MAAVEGSLAAMPAGRWIAAVSGGRDSMVLLDAMARSRRGEIAAVATFDHGTGPAARRAARLVERTGLGLELPVVSGAMPAGAAVSEAAWRAARWRFLDGWAEELRATVVTAHTRDDQIETVFQRLLRGAGVRGLAGMRAEDADAAAREASERPPRVRRPLLAVRRADVAAYADARRIAFVEDPSNATLAFQRNRVRHELLPAFERCAPGFGEWCWSLGERAARWREDVATVVRNELRPTLVSEGTLVLRADRVATLREPEWRVIWAELVGRVGLALDWRGLERASAWAPDAEPGTQIPLSGGGRIERTASTFVLRGQAVPTRRYYIDDSDDTDRSG